MSIRCGSGLKESGISEFSPQEEVVQRDTAAAAVPPLPSLWRVVLVRHPEDQRSSIQQLLSPEVQLVGLPRVVLATPNRDMATTLALRLRATGATVVLSEEPNEDGQSGYCAHHPAQLAHRLCAVCSAPLCLVCDLAVPRGQCAGCVRAGATKRRLLRVRKLFALFLFFVFLYLVIDHIQTDRFRVDPSRTVTVVVLQFAPRGTVNLPIIRALNDQDGPPGTSLHHLADWFDGERDRYGGTATDYLRVEVRGPWAVAFRPPYMPRPEDPVGMFKRMRQSWDYSRYFHGLASDYGVDLDRYSVRVFLNYDRPDGYDESDSRGSEKGRLAITHVPVDEPNAGYALTSVAHEIAHTLGAADQYDLEWSGAQHPEGFVQPFANPLYPQKYAELMAVDIPVGPRLEREVQSLDQVRIGHRTAADMGWIGPEQADLFYTPPALAPQDKLEAPSNGTQSKDDAPGALTIPAADTVQAP